MLMYMQGSFMSDFQTTDEIALC